MLSKLIKAVTKVSIQTKDTVLEKGPTVAGNFAARAKSTYESKMAEYKDAAKNGVDEARSK
jgi:hypothetical protein